MMFVWYIDCMVGHTRQDIEYSAATATGKDLDSKNLLLFPRTVLLMPTFGLHGLEPVVFTTS